MKRPKLEDTRIKIGEQSISGQAVSVYVYSRLQDKYIDYLEKELKKAKLK